MLLLVGGFLLSHTLPGAVPLALAGLASGFGMGPGVSPPLSTTDTFVVVGPTLLCPLGWGPLLVVGVVWCVRYRRMDALRCWFVLVFWFWCISTGRLTTLLWVQFRPINPIVFGEPVKPHLKTGFPLRCFQRLSFPYVANQRCSWRNNWHTRGTSVPVLSY